MVEISSKNKTLKALPTKFTSSFEFETKTKFNKLLIFTQSSDTGYRTHECRDVM